jgi:hypothetical protein
MAATLKWDGDELKLGATKMAEVAAVDPSWQEKGVHWRHTHGPWSETYQEKEDAMQDCFNAVHALLKKASG